VPADAVGEANLQRATDPAAAGHNQQLGQFDLLQVAIQRTTQLESAGGAVQAALECTAVATVLVIELCYQFAQRHRRSLHGIQPLPGEILPVQFSLAAQSVLPVGLASQTQ